jgi:hypothetical protein
VEPILTCYYRSSRLKQYFKEGRGLRTESVICVTRDFDIGRRVCAKNWNALRAVGESVNRRLCDAEAHDAMPSSIPRFRRRSPAEARSPSLGALWAAPSTTSRLRPSSRPERKLSQNVNLRPA